VTISAPELALDATAAAAPPGAGGAPTRSFRPDIEGLRAIAVLGVLLFHASAPFMAGGYVGVDVFFVLSGFLITSLLIDERSRTGTLSLVRFYGRRARRLLPASALIVLLALLGAWLVGGPLVLRQVGADARSVASFTVNFRFAGQQTGYFRPTSRPSPFQHFWSLAVEEQFYFVWPGLLLLLAWGARNREAVRRRVLLFLAVLIPLSFLWCVLQTRSDQPHAFFLLPSRAWELGIGALLAAAPIRALRRSTATLLSVGGLALVVGSFVLLEETTAFPGWIVAAPVLGTAALLVVGAASPDALLPRMLSWRPLQQIGKYSYSLYLWHWALLVVVAMAKHRVLSSFPKGALIVALSVPPAIASFHLLEDPVRRSAWLAKVPRRSLGLGLGLIATSLLAAVLAVQLPALATERTAPSPTTALRPTDFVPENLTPTLLHARTDGSSLADDPRCDIRGETVADKPCYFGNLRSDTTVALLGDSHANMWFPAILDFVEKHDWKLEVDVTAGCAGVLYHDSGECETHRELVFDRLARERPDFVVLVEYGRLSLDRGVTAEGWQDALGATIRRVPDSRWIIFGESPRPGEGRDAADECVAKHLGHVRTCEQSPQDPLFNHWVQMGRSVARSTGSGFVDLTPVMCTETRCPVIDGNILVFGDENHVTDTFARYVSPRVVRAMDAATRAARG
jgi:peptidoglycan/LPS O-acetylase OafA/YrhL